mmetsp:Transcript_2163/g.2481  ORF Transcript_2163/g.2481 Transcript_2163/m.2481 type:complete len:131 (+) Transcript_2163:16-408(+)
MGSCFSLISLSFLSFFSNANGGASSLSSVFSDKNFLFAASGLTSLLLLQEYFNRKNGAQAQDEEQIKENEEGNSNYRRADYEIDSRKDLLQTIQRDGDDCFKLKLVQIIKLNHDSYFYKFDFPNKNQELG